MFQIMNQITERKYEVAAFSSPIIRNTSVQEIILNILKIRISYHEVEMPKLLQKFHGMSTSKKFHIDYRREE